MYFNKRMSKPRQNTGAQSTGPSQRENSTEKPSQQLHAGLWDQKTGAGRGLWKISLPTTTKGEWWGVCWM